ncbi:putative permease, DMT superfamily [Actinoalloteichus sp. GBA129-24]|nr:putative permease, DMT superfamily [Actinoalloteichus sp. GBA129-24]
MIRHFRRVTADVALPAPGAGRATVSPVGELTNGTPTAGASGGSGSPAGGRPAALLLVMTGGFSVQFGAAVAVSLFVLLGPVGTVALRLTLAALVLLAITRPRLRGRTRGDLISVVGLGLALATMNIGIYEAMARMPLGPAVTLEFLGPLGLAVVLSRRLRDVAWVLLAGAGVILLSSGGFDRLDPVGVLFSLGAGAGWACYILLSAQAGRRFPGVQGLALAMCVAAVIALPLGIASAGTALFVPSTLAVALAVALLSSVLPYSVEMHALRRIPARVFGVLMSLGPAMAALAGFLVLGQRLSIVEVVAIGLVIVASGGATFFSRPQAEPSPT